MTLGFRLASAVSRTPLHRPLSWLAGRMERYLDVAGNFNNCDFASNGEGFLVRRAAPHWRLALDVGANVGDWTRTVLEANPACTIHAFEPSPRTFDLLHDRLGGQRSVTLHNLGVGAAPGELAFHDHGPGSVLSSFVDRTGSVGESSEQVIPIAVTSLDAFLQGQAGARVDYVKVDTEGFEMQVLHGLHRSLAARKVDCVQFEYGGTWLDVGASLREAALLTESAGYGLFRLLPNGVTQVSYDHRRDETFKYANFLAVADTDILRRWGVPF